MPKKLAAPAPSIFLLLGVEIELAGILTAVASFNVSLEGSSIVATNLVNAGAEGSGTVVLAGDDVGVGLEAAFEVRTYGSNEDHEEILVSGFHTYLSASTDEKGTEVEGCAGAVRGNEMLVEFDNLLAHFNEELGGEFGHHDAAAGALQTCSVSLDAETADLAVLATESLEAFKSLLAIV